MATDFSELDSALAGFTEQVTNFKAAVQTDDQKAEALANAQKAKESAGLSRDEADTRLESALTILVGEFKALGVDHVDELSPPPPSPLPPNPDEPLA